MADIEKPQFCITLTYSNGKVHLGNRIYDSEAAIDKALAKAKKMYPACVCKAVKLVNWLE